MANVFYLDVDDEITSAAARIRTSQDPRVGLVVPPGSRIATSRINFRLLAREALERNRALSIVSTDAAARALAASAGLPAFATVAEFEADQGVVRPVAETPAPGSAARRSKAAGPAPAVDAAAAAAAPAAGAAARPRPAGPLATPGIGAGPESRIGARSSGASAAAVRAPSRASRRPGRIAASAVTVVLIAVVLGLMGAFLLPSATIVVTPKLETIGPNQVSIRADPNATSTDPVAGVVPAVVLTMDFTASGTFNATGVKVNTTSATGTVEFNNNDTGNGVTIPSGSRVSTEGGAMFATTQDVTVPRARFKPSFRPGSASVGVTAVTAGTAGNVAAGAIDQVPSGYNSVLLNVTNPTATKGGTKTTTIQIQKKDTDAAVASLTKNLKSQFTAWAAAPDGLSPGSTAYPKTAVLGTATPGDDPAALIGVVQPTFQLGLTASASVTAVDQATVTSLAASRIESSVAESFRLVSGSTTVTVGTPRTDGAAVIFPVTATARVVRDLDPDTLRGQVAGKSLDEARAILAAYGAVDIQTWPGFVGTVPSLAWRLSLSIDTSQAGGPPAQGPSPSVPAGQPSGRPSSAPSGSASGALGRADRGRG